MTGGWISVIRFKKCHKFPSLNCQGLGISLRL